MKRLGLLIAFFAALFIVLPNLPAQDEKKKDPDKADKKDDTKKDDPEKKKDEPEKKKDKDKDEPKKEKLVYGNKFISKIISANGPDITVEIPKIDPKKQQDVANWSAQQLQQLNNQAAQVMQQFNQANQKTKPNERAQALQGAFKAQANYQTAYAKYQMELAKKDITTPTPYDVHAVDDVKVRAMVPPVEFDDLGFEKKWTKKELEEKRDKTGLPGFPSDLDQLKAGLYVEIYMAKTQPKEKDQPKKKKGPDDDPAPEVKTRPDFVMIVILQQPPQPK